MSSISIAECSTGVCVCVCVYVHPGEFTSTSLSACLVHRQGIINSLWQLETKLCFLCVLVCVCVHATMYLMILQVSCALNFLHREKSIVHFDLKPDNVLVFQFPSHGHQCYAQGKPLKLGACIHCINSPGVLVKLADLGISAIIGPGGFNRKMASPGHTAPEALKHLGKEQMTEKVSKFSHIKLSYLHIG